MVRLWHDQVLCTYQHFIDPLNLPQGDRNSNLQQEPWTISSTDCKARKPCIQEWQRQESHKSDESQHGLIEKHCVCLYTAQT